MPGRFEPERTTLVMSSRKAGLDMLSANSHRVVLDIIQNSAPPEGFTASAVISIAAERDVKRSSVYDALQLLVNDGYVEMSAPRNGRATYPANGNPDPTRICTVQLSSCNPGPRPGRALSVQADPPLGVGRTGPLEDHHLRR